MISLTKVEFLEKNFKKKFPVSRFQFRVDGNVKTTMYPWVWKTGLLFWISEAILNMCVVVTIYYWIKPSKLPKFSSFVEILHSELPQKVKCMQILFSLVFSLLTKSRNRRINFGATVVVVKLPLCRLCWLHTEPEWPIQAAQPPWIKDNRIFDINPHKETLATSPRLL